MPMLAERRRKSKWTLNPGRRALWNNAESSGIKFGQGLMEKMGWRVGQGLGVNEQGMTEPLKISSKTDSKGIGFKDTDSIEWVQQQNDFNKLLEKLSSSNARIEQSACNEAEAFKTRTSLEERSKHSKTRVHYHKFTRGKDLTKYSEKDLECIVGSKKELVNSGKVDKDESDSFSKPELDQLTTYAGSMVDYFTKKLQKKRSAGGNITSLSDEKCQEIEDLHCNNNDESEDDIRRVKKKKKKKEKEINPCYEWTDNGINFKRLDCKVINHNCLDDVNNCATSVNKDTDHGNKCLKSVSIEDCPQELNNDRNGEKSCVRDENHSGQSFSGDNTEGKHFKKLKKKRRKERETMENEEVIEGKKKKFDNKRVEHSEDMSPPRKKDVDTAGKIENSSDCFYTSYPKESEAFNRGKTKKMDYNNEDISEDRRKKKRKEKAGETENGADYTESMANEEVEHCKVMKPRKKEKAVALSRTTEDGARVEYAQVTDYKDDKVHAEEVPKPEKREKKKEKDGKISRALDSNDGEENGRRTKHKKDSVNSENEVQTEEELKPEKSKKRREKNVDGDVDRMKCEEVADFESDKKHGRNDDVRSKKVLNPCKKDKIKEISNNIDCDGKKTEKEEVAQDKNDKIYSKTCQIRDEQVSHYGKRVAKRMSCYNPVAAAFPGSSLKMLKGYGCETK